MPQSSVQQEHTVDDREASSVASRKPVDKFHDGSVHVSIWENAGPKGAFRTASFELRYRDKEQQWQTGHSYTVSDLKHLEAAAQEARTRLENWQQEKSPPATMLPAPENSATNTPRDCFTTSSKETSLLGARNRAQEGGRSIKDRCGAAEFEFVLACQDCACHTVFIASAPLRKCSQLPYPRCCGCGRVRRDLSDAALSMHGNRISYAATEWRARA
jgi:hypothetical protein